MNDDEKAGWEDLQRADETDVTRQSWRLDEAENALDYLEMAVRQLMETERNPWAWKWVVIGLHGALYGFGVCAVVGTDCHRVTFATKSGRRMLDKFDVILEKCQGDMMRQFVHSKRLTLTRQQRDSIDFVKNVLRNNLEHYIPGLTYVDPAELPPNIKPFFDVIEFLAVDSGNVTFFQRPGAHERVRALCESGRRLATSARAAASDDFDDVPDC